MMIEKKTTKEILDTYYWNEDGNSYDEYKEWISVESIADKLSESLGVQEECVDFEEAWTKLAMFLTELTKELKGDLK